MKKGSKWQVFIPSELIIRRSCGCWPPAVQRVSIQPPVFYRQNEQAPSQTESRPLEAVLAEHRADILATVSQSFGALVLPDKAVTLATVLYNALVKELVDAGDPQVWPTEERMANGARLNMGAFGGTYYASMSEWGILGDRNYDGAVNIEDFAIIAYNWLTAAEWAQ